MKEALVDMKSATKLFSFEEYKELVFSLFEEGKVTGNIQNEDKIDATKMNIPRIKRLDKRFEISIEMQQALDKIEHPQDWYVISEGWCGDSAQTLPLIAKIAANSDKVNLSVILRDDNPDIMNAYLTNGGAAVPKLIARDRETGKDIFTWGARPAKIQQMVMDYKAEFTLSDKAEFHKNLHLWYARDKGIALQENIIGLL